MGLSTNGQPITPYLGSWAYHQAADRAGHHHYKCFHTKGTLDVRAPTLLDARNQACAFWRLGPKRAHEVATVLYARHEPATPSTPSTPATPSSPTPVPLSPASL